MIKYKNEEWLKYNYLDKKLNAFQISQLCNISLHSIYYWLEKYNISRRIQSEINYLNFLNHLKDKKYSNKNWLQNKYEKEKLSATQIGKLCECNAETIRYWLKKFNIPIRSRSEGIHLVMANRCNLSNKAKQWIDGELLGDGCLQSRSNYCARFSYGSKYEEYIHYVSNTLQSFGIKQSGKIIKRKDNRFDCYKYQYATYSYEELLPIQKRWYPQGKKIIPRDLEITPLLLRQEYIGDGCLNHQRKGNGRPHITLSTDGFPIDDVEWLVKQLNQLGFKSTRQPLSNRIGISAYSTKQFLDYIGKCPVECYNYKWAY